MEILIKRLRESATLPTYGHVTDPGVSLFVATSETIAPGQRVSLPVGVALAIPVGYIGLIWEQGGAEVTNGLSVVPKVVDSGFRQEVTVEVVNRSEEPLTVSSGQCVAQMLIEKIEQPRLIEAEDLSEAAEYAE